MIERPIGVFDSGVGGLTAVREIKKVLPYEDVVYFGDTARVPYGSHSSAIIQKYALEDMRFLLDQGVKAILVACGTVSSTSLEVLKENSNVPVIGVIFSAAHKAAVTGKKIGVIATNATIASHAFKKTILSINSDCEVFEKACPLFVPIIENGYVDTAVARMIVEDYLEELKLLDVDTLILGCTHYPLLRNIINDYMGKITILEAGREAVADLKYLLETNNLSKNSGRTGEYRYYVSEKTDAFADVCRCFLGEKLSNNFTVYNID